MAFDTILTPERITWHAADGQRPGCVITDFPGAVTPHAGTSAIHIPSSGQALTGLAAFKKPRSSP